MDAEPLGPLGLQHPERLGDLGTGHAVLGVAGGVHHLEPLLALPQGEHAAGVVAAEHGLRDLADGLLQKFHMGEVVQVDHRPQAAGELVLLRQGVVGGKHDLLPPETALLRQHQLRQAGAVGPAALILQQLQQGGGGGCLHGEILLEARVPGKGLVQGAGVGPEAPLVVEVEGGGVLGGDCVELPLGHKGCFHVDVLASFP